MLIETTKKQDEVIDYFRKFYKTHGEPPTIRDAAKALGYEDGSIIWVRLKALEKKGLMKNMRGLWFVVEKPDIRMTEGQ